MRILPALLLALTATLPLPLRAQETLTLSPVTIPVWKAVHGRIEARDRIPARARIGGTLTELSVTEGDIVTAGQPIATISDAKLGFQLTALQAERAAAAAQLANAETDLQRGTDLMAEGVTTVQRLDALRTEVNVLRGRIAALDAQAEVVQQQQRDGQVLAPVAGRVLDVPVAAGTVLMPGESVALIGGGGIFLRLAIPERHATDLQTGDSLLIGEAGAEVTGRLVRIYPLIENGRVLADVEVADLPDDFVDARVRVRLPVGDRPALMVPQTAIATRSGIDFVAVMGAEGPRQRAVIPGERLSLDGVAMVEVLSGLQAGDAVLVTAPAPVAAAPESADE